MIDIKTLTADLTDEQLELVKQLMAVAHYKDQAPKKPTAAQLRKKHPALKDAYDQYKMILKLVSQEDYKNE